MYRLLIISRIIFVFFCIVLGNLTGCAQSPMNSNIPQKNIKTKILVESTNPHIVQWTSEALESFCQYGHWGKNVKYLVRSHHKSKLRIFNQASKTKITVDKKNRLHIYFQLGGVLMGNYFHELVIYPPASCKLKQIEYITRMQATGNSVVYAAKEK